MNSTEQNQEQSGVKKEQESLEENAQTNDKREEMSERPGTNEHYPTGPAGPQNERGAAVEGGPTIESGEGLVQAKEKEKTKEEQAEEIEEKKQELGGKQQQQEEEDELDQEKPLQPEGKVEERSQETVPKSSNQQEIPQPTGSQIKPEDSPSANAQNSIQIQSKSDSEQAEKLSPQVQELLAIFPQIQPSILEDVLAAHRNDVSACISDLLAISDPTYKPSAQESMVQSDEELARQLSLQESQQHPASHQSSSLNEQQQISNLPYQPRVKRNTPPNRTFNRTTSAQQVEQASADPAGQTGLSSGGKDEIQKIAEEIGKLAETGKKTMSLWLEKAKAKMQEIQLPNPPASQSESLEGGYEHVSRPSSSSNPPPASAFNPSNPSALSTTKNARITPALPHASRYANTNRSTPSTQSSARSLGGPVLSPHQTPSQNSRGAVEGYKVEGPHSSSTPHDREKIAGSKADASLPKIPSAQSSTILADQQSSKIRDDDEESLEYTRNPFEDDD